MSETKFPRRVIEVHEKIFGPPPPRGKTVKTRKRSDFPGVDPVYMEVAEKLSSPLLMGPPLCDELVALVCHLFTEEEAALVRHLGIFRGMSAEGLAKAERRPVDEVIPILHRLAIQKRAIIGSGPGGKKSYRLLQLFPGIFEMVLIGAAPESLTPWHRRFAELFEALFETGYWLDYGREGATPFVRYLPLAETIAAHPMALPTDRLEPLLDQYKVFAVGQCQCRLTMQIKGQGCGKPLGNCALMGDMALKGIGEGWLRPVSKREMLEIKREAERHGLVNWMFNVRSDKMQSSCSCCGCCCHGFRMVNEFNAPSWIAPPRYVPKMDASSCSWCGKCALACPMAAITMDTKAKTYRRSEARCIGCGLCVVACEKKKAAVMVPVPESPLPYRGWSSLMARATVDILRTAFDVWRSRR